MAVPPSTIGAAHDRATVVFPRVPTTAVGSPGTPVGVTAFEAAESEPVPRAFTARTWRVYVVPLTRPVIVPDVAPAAMPVRVTIVPTKVGVATI